MIDSARGMCCIISAGRVGLLFTPGEAFVSAHAQSTPSALPRQTVCAEMPRWRPTSGPTIPSTTSFGLCPLHSGGNRLERFRTFRTSSAKLRQRAASPTAAFKPSPCRSLRRRALPALHPANPQNANESMRRPSLHRKSPTRQCVGNKEDGSSPATVSRCFLHRHDRRITRHKCRCQHCPPVPTPVIVRGQASTMDINVALTPVRRRASLQLNSRWFYQRTLHEEILLCSSPPRLCRRSRCFRCHADAARWRANGCTACHQVDRRLSAWPTTQLRFAMLIRTPRSWRPTGKAGQARQGWRALAIGAESCLPTWWLMRRCRSLIGDGL